MTGTNIKKLGELLEEVNRPVFIEDTAEYKCGGVRLNGNGAFVREYKLGIEIKKKFVQHQTHTDDIVYSTLFAKAGAFAVVDESVDGSILSEKFPTFRLVDDRVNLDYLRWFFRSGQLKRIAESQATGIAAFSLSHLNKKKFLQLPIPVPSKARQEEVVSKCKQAFLVASSAREPIVKNLKLAEHLIPASGEQIFLSLSHSPIKQIGTYVMRNATIVGDKLYQQITVAMNHKGLRLRRICEGSEIKSAGQCYVNEGDILFSRIDLRNGAIGFVSSDLEGAVVTRDFPVFVVDSADPTARRFLSYVFRSVSFMSQAKGSSKGTTGRKKLKRDQFLNIVIPWPNKAKQAEIVERLDVINKHSETLVAHYRSQLLSINKLARSIVESLYAQDAGIISQNLEAA